jgi:Ribbon-helix-helix protein, copG family
MDNPSGSSSAERIIARITVYMQITIYLDDDTMAMVNAAAKASGVSKSQWIAEAIQLRSSKEWPASVAALAGAWSDFPSAEEIRRNHGADTSRERL